MRQKVFEDINRPLWQELQRAFTELERHRCKRIIDASSARRLPRLYRQICNHYALARARRYSPTLVAELHALVYTGHRYLYRPRGALAWRLFVFIAVGFPRALRQHIGYFLLALMVFLIPAVFAGGYCYTNSEIIYSILDVTRVEASEHMYDPSNRTPGRAVERTADSDFIMFGYYIYNNISVGFRTFAGGVLLGVGTLFFLVFNGTVIGGLAGHLTRIGYQDTFWSFVIGHSALELTAIVICGAAGLMLGHALLAPGQHTRRNALKLAATQALPLVMGATLMLLAAALVEAFWSSSQVTAGAKYGVGALLWVAVITYLGFAGVRWRGSR